MSLRNSLRFVVSLRICRNPRSEILFCCVFCCCVFAIVFVVLFFIFLLSVCSFRVVLCCYFLFLVFFGGIVFFVCVFVFVCLFVVFVCLWF